MGAPEAILIAGPTASGKSALALRLAGEVGGIVVNADSMQVYHELRILTARPSEAELAIVPHALYGHVPAAEAYSAGRWIEDVKAVLSKARSEGRVPVIVGGTGLYFKALLEGLSPIPEVPPDVRARWRNEALSRGAEAIHGELVLRDPAMAARLAPGDRQRVTRALEVLEATGRSLADWQSQPGTPLLVERDVCRLLLMPERSELRRRCDARFDAMLQAGALAEVARLAALRLSPELPSMRALGVPQLLAFQRGERPLAPSVAVAKAETRQYAKRQITWMRRNMVAWNGIGAQDMETAMRGIMAIIRRYD